MLKKTSSATTISVIALPQALPCREGRPEKLAVNRVEDEGEHDRTPLIRMAR
ncbi:MAG: hypothetical protein QOJ42_2829 [Acidobacteriaceae bacterium]|jgi:hypothetical protein|nr:hypothetical protein [Acidobacteriaceae bacterium]